MNETKKPAWVKIPHQQASKEEWARFFNELGRPGEATAYQFTPQNIGFYDNELVEDFKNIAHKAGLNQQQAQIVHDGMVEILSEKYKQAQMACEHNKQNITQQIQQKWGTAYASKLKKAQEAAHHFGFKPQDVDSLENIVGSESVLEGLMRIGEGLHKDTSLMDMGQQQNISTVQTAKQKRAELSRDESFLAALMDKNHPGHKEAVAELDRLNNIIVNQ